MRPSFAAYGERRDGTDWDGGISSGDLNTLAGITRRGFTGHEHLDAVGLIHMNGRVYEPIAGRFLGRDPVIDGFASSQGPNGYAYVHNSPLSLVDPSGFNCDPPPGMSDEEAGAYISRCSVEFESGGYGILGQNERWCAAMDLGCQQGILRQRIDEQIYTRTIFNDMLAARQMFTGSEIVVTATRLGGETTSWAQSQMARDPFAGTIVVATLPDGSKGYLLAIPTNGNSRPRVGPPTRPEDHGSPREGLSGLVATAGIAHSMIELSRSMEGLTPLRLLGKIAPGLGIVSAAMSWSRGNYFDAIVTGGLAIGGGVALFVGSAPVAGVIGVVAIGYTIGQIALDDDGT